MFAKWNKRSASFVEIWICLCLLCSVGPLSSTPIENLNENKYAQSIVYLKLTGKKKHFIVSRLFSCAAFASLFLVEMCYICISAMHEYRTLLIYRNINKFLLVFSYLFSYRDSISFFSFAAWYTHTAFMFHTWIFGFLPIECYFIFFSLFVAFKRDNTLQTKTSSSCQVLHNSDKSYCYLTADALQKKNRSI